MGVHDRIVIETYSRIKNKYDAAWVMQDYNNNGYVGEFDILTRIHRNGSDYYHYYEIKSTRNNNAIRRAKKQFKKARRAFPQRHFKFILVTQNSIERFRSLEERI